MIGPGGVGGFSPSCQALYQSSTGLDSPRPDVLVSRPSEKRMPRSRLISSLSLPGGRPRIGGLRTHSGSSFLLMPTPRLNPAVNATQPVRMTTASGPAETLRSEERRVGKEVESRGHPEE